MIFEKENYKFIKHDSQAGLFDEGGVKCRYQLKNLLFENFKRKQKSRENSSEPNLVDDFLKTCKENKLFTTDVSVDLQDRLKADNMELMKTLYDCPSDFGSFHGENNLDHGKVTKVGESTFLIPPHCKFFNKDVGDIESCLPFSSNKFDFIVIDPPWGNRFIKRAKKNSSLKRGYLTMTDDDILNVPIENYIKASSIVVIWCTNSETHIKSLQEKFIPKWNLKLLSTWKWFKVDRLGELFCSIDGNKKPFELVFITTHRDNNDCSKELEEDQHIFSHPSSVHSHKPPLLDVFLTHLPTQPMCLEIFARSLNKGFTSIGLEVIKLQNLVLFEKTN